MEVNARLTLDTNAQLIGTSGTLNDITDARRPKNDYGCFESVVVNANDAVLITTAEPIDEPGPHAYTNEAHSRNWLQPAGSVDTAPTVRT